MLPYYLKCKKKIIIIIIIIKNKKIKKINTASKYPKVLKKKNGRKMLL